ncbi:hypothetical protein Fcan01_20597 [Folsomia candida]|uniref:Uncharacterized protein n=1 Tax=Folsomia candida TaxID=158441 RepID=A0A226DIP1_FOLCA|nr:hypothetical protein Fcan01_20597 [Folsomia candida]
MDVLKKQMEGMEANILKHQETLSKQLSDVVKDLGAWREKMEGEISSLKEGQTTMEARIIGVEEKLLRESIKDTLLQEVREEFVEQKQRLIRMCNIILMGVPESTEGLNVAAQLMKVIVPEWVGPLHDNRIGDPEGRKPRPIRINLSTVQQKTQALKNCSMLKDRTEFKTISVRKDLTRQEQTEWKEKSKARVVKGTGATSSERMATRLSKRKNDCEHDSQQSKIHRVDVSNMETN